MNERMQINKDNALKLWAERYGNQQTVIDFSGRKMTRGQYGDQTSKTGWNIDHRQPQANGGTNHKNNLEIVNVKTNNEKSDKTSFEANGKKYHIVKDNEKFSYKIEEINKELPSIDPKKMSLNERQKLINAFCYDNKDFAGYPICPTCIDDSSKFAWGIDLYDPKKGYINGNYYVASLLAIAERDGRTSFEANGNRYKMRKLYDGYNFITLDEYTHLENFGNLMAYTSAVFNDKLEYNKDWLYIFLFDNCSEDEYYDKVAKFYLVLHRILKATNLEYTIVPASDRVDIISVIFNTYDEFDTLKVHEVARTLFSLIDYFRDNEIFNIMSTYHGTTEYELNEHNYFYEFNQNDIIDEMYEENSILMSSDVVEKLILCNINQNDFILEDEEEEIYSRSIHYGKLDKIINDFE